MFGRVIHGFERIEEIGHLPTDEKDRPLTEVSITHSGELELKRPKKPPTPSPSVSGESDVPAARGRRRRKEESDDDSGDERRREKKSRKHRDKNEKDGKRSKKREKRDKVPKEETMEELDARLEREEKQRLEDERVEQEAILKRTIEREKEKARENGEVVYKGECGCEYYISTSRSHFTGHEELKICQAAGLCVTSIRNHSPPERCL